MLQIFLPPSLLRPDRYPPAPDRDPLESGGPPLVPTETAVDRAEATRALPLEAPRYPVGLCVESPEAERGDPEPCLRLTPSCVLPEPLPSGHFAAESSGLAIAAFQKQLEENSERVAAAERQTIHLGSLQALANQPDAISKMLRQLLGSVL